MTTEIEITKVTTQTTAPKAKTKTPKAKKSTMKTKAPAKVTKAPRGQEPLFSLNSVAKRLAKFKTIHALAKELNVTKPTAINYVHKLMATRKVETQNVRQGIRGPQAIAYRVS